MWQWVVIYVVGAGVIYGLVYFLFLAKKGGTGYGSSPAVNTSTSTQQVTPGAAGQTENTVTLDSNGFAPATLTVKAGGTVTWWNKSGQQATVNSNPHPVHTDYPPLNLGSFPDGGSLSLKFDQPGSYGYHNHANPSQRGTIVVE